ncbi:tetratricopeptide repeat protein [Nostoc sp.]|uniref:tetratricopeptide repeat protein n=1 Tax=Nostoc sp. TaxID=1180 RepID=UPI003FA54843
MELKRKLLGDEHPDVATNLNNLAYLYRDQGRYSERSRNPFHRSFGTQAQAAGKRTSRCRTQPQEPSGTLL